MARLNNGFRRGYLSSGKTLNILKEMGEHVVEAAKRALKEGADEVVVDAKSRCPVDHGKLRDSIKTISNRDGTVYKIAADAQNEDNGEYYGQYVEFDPRIGGSPTGRILYPALDAHETEIYQKVKDAIRNATRS